MSESSEDEARPDQGDADDTNAIQQVGSHFLAWDEYKTTRTHELCLALNLLW